MMCLYIETYQITRQICNSNWFGVRIPRLSRRDKQHLPSPKTKGRLKLCWNISGQKNPITYNFQTYVGVRECVRVCGWVWRSVWSSVCLVCVLVCVFSCVPNKQGLHVEKQEKTQVCACQRDACEYVNECVYVWECGSVCVNVCKYVCQCVWKVKHDGSKLKRRKPFPPSGLTNCWAKCAKPVAAAAAAFHHTHQKKEGRKNKVEKGWPGGEDEGAG